MPNAELRPSSSVGIWHSTFGIERCSRPAWLTAGLLSLTIVYAVLQVGFVRRYLPAEPRLNWIAPCGARSR